mmetsp:Transcript_64967/g.149063  ORF Transcript_64967/g.149063 Transcript_64967/m.149063 type:complete len:381 (+) Transcript_64967:31-1173(+)
MGSYLSEPVRDKTSESGSNDALEWGASAMQGWRTEMEDAHICMVDVGQMAPQFAGVGLFAVFDGHGGKEVARYCAKHFGRATIKSASPKDLSSFLMDSFLAIDDALREPTVSEELAEMKKSCLPDGTKTTDVEERTKALDMLKDSIQKDLEQYKEVGTIKRDEASQVMMKMMFYKKLEAQNMGGPYTADNVGCTAVAMCLTKSDIVVANCGDSRAVLCRGGRAKALTKDHKPNDPVERQRIQAAGGQVQSSNLGKRVQYRINGNLNLSRALGDLDFKKDPSLKRHEQMVSGTPEITKEPLSQEDEFVLMCCDGVWDVKTNQEAVDFCRQRLMKGMRIEKVLEQLLDDCLAEDPKENGGLGTDNMTALLVKLKRGGRGRMP